MIESERHKYESCIKQMMVAITAMYTWTDKLIHLEPPLDEDDLEDSSMASTCLISSNSSDPEHEGSLR